jgi:integrase
VVEKAIQCVDGFEKVYKLLQQQVTLRGQSRSTLENYIRRVALVSLHFGKLPEQLCDDEINEYLTSLALSAKSPSRSSFKHAVYGLRIVLTLIYSAGLRGQEVINLKLSDIDFERNSLMTNATPIVTTDVYSRH